MTIRTVGGDGAGPVDLLIRAAEPSDIEAFVALETQPRTREYLGIIGRSFHERALSDPDQEHVVAEVGGEVVGFVVLAGLREGGGEIELRRIVFSHQLRGMGYGRTLFRAAVARTYGRHGASRLWLDVKPGNTRARALYAAEGLVETGTIPDPTDPGGVLLLMVYPPADDKARPR